MTRIAVLHPGQMGAAIGGALADNGHQVGWIPPGRSEATAQRARIAGLAAWDDLDGVDLVISLVPPAAALQTVQRLKRFDGVYLDANAISPDRAAGIATIATAAGAVYVDGGVVGPPPVQGGTTRLLLSGNEAPWVAALFSGSRVESVVLDEGPFAASALKMVYAAMTKISAALILATSETAAAYGITDALMAEWGRSQPGFIERLRRAEVDGTAKGWRWGDEMRQIAVTFLDAGMPAGFAEAAAAIFDRYGRPD